ncbi:hypothetical protein ACIRS1_24060 [Kitasatospora sp. NPDC101176]|uniref:hypothetical protein n=1 Tax=Kitasatospora sp. NPDC101176 TaxID=3364099 RepID=UPI0038173DCF
MERFEGGQKNTVIVAALRIGVRSVEGGRAGRGHLAFTEAPRLELAAGPPDARSSAMTTRSSLEEGDLAAGKATAAERNTWIVFEDEAGQSIAPDRNPTEGCLVAGQA